MNEHDMVEDTEQEEVSELDYPPEGELSSLMLMGFPSDRIYMVYDCGEVYYFRYLGNETFGIDTELLLAQTPHRGSQKRQAVSQTGHLQLSAVTQAQRIDTAGKLWFLPLYI